MLSLLSESCAMSPWEVIEEALARKRPVRGPKWLADQLGEKIQTVMNWKARGVPARRYRDVAGALGLTVDQLEGVAPLPWPTSGQAEWPFSDELHAKVILCSEDELYRLENVMRAHLDMPQQSSPNLSHGRQFDVSSASAHQYARGPEDVAGLPNDMQVPAPGQHGQRATDRGRPHKKSGGGA